MPFLGEPDLGESSGDQQFNDLRIQLQRNEAGVAGYPSGWGNPALRMEDLHGRTLEARIGCFAAGDEVAIGDLPTDLGSEQAVEGHQRPPRMAARIAKLQQPHVDYV